MKMWPIRAVAKRIRIPGVLGRSRPFFAQADLVGMEFDLVVDPWLINNDIFENNVVHGIIIIVVLHQSPSPMRHVVRFSLLLT